MFHLTKYGKLKEELGNALELEGRDLAKYVVRLTLFHCNKKNRQKWKSDCFKSFNEVQPIKKNKNLKADFVVKHLQAQINYGYIYDISSYYVDSIPNPLRVDLSDADTIHNITDRVLAYLLWAGTIAATGTISKVSCYEMLESITSVDSEAMQ